MLYINLLVLVVAPAIMGKLSRHLYVRICKHMSLSNLTINLGIILPFSSILKYSTSYSKISPNSFKMIQQMAIMILSY